jgi:methyltransferase (TIGR00027 family)
MRQQQSSQSAAGVATLRAMEALRPESERICYDPYAHAFVTPGITFSITKWIINSGLYERMAPGATGFIFVRERYIDDTLKAALADGLDQVVILGAGFDTRAYRIPGMEKTRVFEIDHPATQAVKLRDLKKVVDPIPANVTFLPVDFNTQTLAGSLLTSGYDDKAKTFFIWQGVTYFLTAEGVDNTLAFIANHSGPGSVVIFDFFYSEIFREKNHPYAKALRRSAKMTGEDYMFGIERGQVETFLTQRGFRDVCEKTLDDLKRIYFTGPNAGRAVAEGIAIVSAKVTNSG